MKADDPKLNFRSVVALLTTHLLVYFHVKKLVTAILTGLKCETRNSCFACSTNVCLVGRLYFILSLVSILLIRD